jgi:hypothetical protein
MVIFMCRDEMTVSGALRVAGVSYDERTEPAKGRNLIRPKIAIIAVHRASNQTPESLAPPGNGE